MKQCYKMTDYILIMFHSCSVKYGMFGREINSDYPNWSIFLKTSIIILKF